VAETAKTVSQALQVLAALGRNGGQTIAELTRELGLARTVVQRLLVTLQAEHYLHRDPDGRYQLGLALVELAARVDHPVRRAAQRPMLALFDQLGETVALTVREADEAVSADQLVAPGQLVRAEYPTGFRHPLTVAAAGRAILAWADPVTVARLTAGRPALGPELDEVRRRGYAYSSDELGHGATGLAAPILDRSGWAVASLGVIAPNARFPAEAAVAGPVVQAARAATEALRAG